MPPETLASILILASAFIHAVVNTLTKSSTDPLLVRGCMNGFALILALPWVAFVPAPSADLFGILLLSTLIHGLYPYLLVVAYRNADLSTAYPLARGSAPVFVLLIDGWLGGHASNTTLSGAIVVCAAITSLVLKSAAGRRLHWRAVAAALGTGMVVGAYTIVDAIGMRAAPSALTYIVWLFVMDGLLVAGSTALVRRAQLSPFLAGHWRSGLLAGTLGVLSYGLALGALRLGPTPAVAALRETSILFAAAIAAVVLRERFGARRVAASAAVVAGIALMHWPTHPD